MLIEADKYNTVLCDRPLEFPLSVHAVTRSLLQCVTRVLSWTMVSQQWSWLYLNPLTCGVLCISIAKGVQRAPRMCKQQWCSWPRDTYWDLWPWPPCNWKTKSQQQHPCSLVLYRSTCLEVTPGELPGLFLSFFQGKGLLFGLILWHDSLVLSAATMAEIASASCNVIILNLCRMEKSGVELYSTCVAAVLKGKCL